MMKPIRLLKYQTTYIVTAALLTFLFTQLAVDHPTIIEHYYSRGIYPVIATVLSYFSGWIPFSVTDLFYVMLILFPVALLVLLLFRKIRIRQLLTLLINTVAIIYISFYWLWGFNYFRQDLNQRLDLKEAQPSTQEFIKAFSWLINETNQSWLPMDSLNHDSIEQAITEAYQTHTPWLRLDTYGKSRPKPLLFSRFWAAASVGGYYGPFFSEIHTNSYLYPTEYPCVLAHETAHRLGITSEAEANFYAWYICHHSTNQRLQYSANCYLLRFFLYQARHLPDFRDSVQPLRKEVREDMKKLHQHYRALMNQKIEKAAGKVNDAYLKTNNVQKGVDDYFGVIKYVMDYRATYSGE